MLVAVQRSLLLHILGYKGRNKSWSIVCDLDLQSQLTAVPSKTYFPDCMLIFLIVAGDGSEKRYTTEGFALQGGASLVVDCKVISYSLQWSSAEIPGRFAEAVSTI